jgi:type IV fimbrial biogenesis protein FimT
LGRQHRPRAFSILSRHKERAEMDRKPTGFSLVEAMVALAIITIGLGIAIPACSGAVAATRSGSARVDLADALLVALNHSALTEADVVVCSSADGARCSGSVDWSKGWIAFADIDRDRARGPNDTLLTHEGSLGGGTHLRSTAGRTRIVFQPHGGAAAGSNVTFTLCDARGPDKATTLVVANDGRLRQGIPTASAAFACVYSG